jgi:hypothetical protein
VLLRPTLNGVRPYSGREMVRMLKLAFSKGASALPEWQFSDVPWQTKRTGP